MKTSNDGHRGFGGFIVQVAGVRSLAEANRVCECGVDWIGFPLRLPVHAQDTSEAEAAEIIASLPRTVRAVLITYLDNADAIRDFCQELGVTTVQLHGPVPVCELRKLRERAPQLTVVKSLVVGLKGEDSAERTLARAEAYVDGFITDTFDPETGASGATGKRHDWACSRRLVEATCRPVILAGGLTPANVAEAVRTVRPAGVDVHTGVETADGGKDARAIGDFCDNARGG